MTARWAYAQPNVTDSKTATVNKPAQCVESTTTTAAPTTTTAAPTTTTTVAEDTTTAPEITTTAAPDATTAAENRPLVTPAPAPQDEGQVAGVQLTNRTVGQTLPTTGAASVPVLVGGAGLLLVGALLVVAARRYGTTV